MTDYRRRQPRLDQGRQSADEPEPSIEGESEDRGYSDRRYGDRGYGDQVGTRSGYHHGGPYDPAYGGDFVDDADDDDGPWAEPPDDGAGGYRPLRIVAIGIVLMIGGGAFWWFSDDQTVGGLPEQAPLIAADDSAFKERPLDAGGLEVPHQDRQILQTLGGRHAPERVESLLPGPEEPVPLAGSEDTGEGLPIIPEASEAAEGDDPFRITQIPDLSPNESPGVAASGDDNGNDSGSGSGEDAVGFDGREDQIAALIEQMGILDDGQQIPEAPLDPQGDPDQSAAEDGGDDGASNGQEPDATADGSEAGEDGEETTAAIEPAPDGGYRVQLGSVDSADAAQSEWSRLTGRHGDVLGRLTLSVQEADISGRAWYRVQAGPLTRESAEQVCAELQGRNAGCIVVGR